MNQCQVNWEDEENNRIIQFGVEYTLDADQVVIEEVTPEAIVFIDEKGQPARRMQVWTETGRNLVEDKQNVEGIA